MAESSTGAEMNAELNGGGTLTRKLKWGVLGTGRIARKLLTAINSSSRGQVWAVASRDARKAEATAQEFHAPHAYLYEELLRDPQVEAVYNSLPNGLHAEWTIKAAQAGKHILCENPSPPT